jgi:hypothetical protein
MFLLCIRGMLNTKDNEVARNTHNNTAGNPQGVAAAQSLGDLSHKVFVPASDAGDFTGGKPGEFLILDIWKSPEGIQTFFSDKNVQEGGSQLFKERDPVVAMAAEGGFSFSLQAPMHKQERYIGLMRGVVKNAKDALNALNGGMKEGLAQARQRGQLAHDIYFKLGPPSADGSAELIGVDLWCDLKGMLATYAEHTAPMLPLFKDRPAMSVWKQPAGTWVEW